MKHQIEVLDIYHMEMLDLPTAPPPAQLGQMLVLLHLTSEVAAWYAFPVSNYEARDASWELSSNN